MIVSNCNDSAVFEKVAKSIGVTVDFYRLSETGKRYRLKVNLDSSTKNKKGDCKYQRESASRMFNEGRKVNAVCWHGFRDFFRACFKYQSDIVFRTAFATWAGSEDFEKRYQESAYINVGSQIYPAYAWDVCRCPDRGSL